MNKVTKLLAPTGVVMASALMFNDKYTPFLMAVAMVVDVFQVFEQDGAVWIIIQIPKNHIIIQPFW